MGQCLNTPHKPAINGKNALSGTRRPSIEYKVFSFKRRFYDEYELGVEIGSGSFGRTHVAIAKKIDGEVTDKRVAVKVIPKRRMTSQIELDDVVREVTILRMLQRHDNVVEFIEAYEDVMNVYIVMELCQGGDLADRILDIGGRCSEASAIPIVWQVLSSVAYMHRMGVIHRDIKPENFLFATEKKDSLLKAIDFGLSGFCGEREVLDDIVGSPYFVAPEILKKAYDLKADEWSIGVLTYILLVGSRPFYGRTESEIFEAVLSKNPDYNGVGITDEAKDFLQNLLTRDVKGRLTAAQALEHPWLKLSCS